MFGRECGWVWCFFSRDVSLCVWVWFFSLEMCVFVCVSLMKAKQKGNTSKQQSVGASPATDLNQQSNSLVSLKQKSTIGKCQVLHPGWRDVCAFQENARNKPSRDWCSTVVLKGGWDGYGYLQAEWGIEHLITVHMITMSWIIWFTFILMQQAYHSVSFFLSTAAMRSWSV